MGNLRPCPRPMESESAFPPVCVLQAEKPRCVHPAHTDTAWRAHRESVPSLTHCLAPLQKGILSHSLLPSLWRIPWGSSPGSVR